MGNRVHVWTVDQPSDIDLCVELGVDAIISNRPKAVLARLGRDGTTASAATHRSAVGPNPDSP